MKKVTLLYILLGFFPIGPGALRCFEGTSTSFKNTGNVVRCHEDENTCMIVKTSPPDSTYTFGCADVNKPYIQNNREYRCLHDYCNAEFPGQAGEKSGSPRSMVGSSWIVIIVMLALGQVLASK